MNTCHPFKATALRLVILNGALFSACAVPEVECTTTTCPAPYACVEDRCVMPPAGNGVTTDAGASPDAGTPADDGGAPYDAGSSSETDAGAEVDGGAVVDAGSIVDGGFEVSDAGSGPDAGATLDAGNTDADGGSLTLDAGEALDAGSTHDGGTADGGSAALDAGEALDAGSTHDAGTADGGAPVDAGTSFDAGPGSSGLRTVTVKRTEQYFDEVSVQSVSLNMNDTKLWVLDAGAYIELPGSVIGSTYVVPNVPQGDYVVRDGPKFMFVSSTDLIDLGGDHQGRADVNRLSPNAAALTISSTGLALWTVRDALLLYSPGAGLLANAFWAWNPPPMEGTSPSALHFDYGALLPLGAPAVDAAKGDSLWLTQVRWVEAQITEVPTPTGPRVSSFWCQVNVAAAHVEGLTVSAGQNLASAEFSTTPTRQTAVTLLRDTFAARADEVHPSSTPTREQVWVSADGAQVVWCDNDPYGQDPIFVPSAVDGGAPVANNLHRTFDSVAPFPANWAVAAYAADRFTHSRAIGGLGTFAAHGWVASIVGDGEALAPKVHSPHDVNLQFESATTIQAVTAGASLPVSWAPSAMAPVATSYQVYLYEVATNGAMTFVMGASTRRTSFTFRPNILAVGHVYFVAVRSTVDVATEAHPRGAWSSYSEAISNPFVAQ